MPTRGSRPGLLPADQLPQSQREVVGPLIEVASRVTGVVLPKLRKLSATASNADIIAKLNEVIARLQED